MASVNFVAIANLAAQSADDKSSLTVTFADGEKVKLKSKDGPFRTIDLDPGETVELRLDLPARFKNTPLVMQALDGGRVSTTDFANAKGKVDTVFRVGSQPGIYRVLLSGGANRAMLRFRVPALEAGQEVAP